jgi:glutaredoxin
MIFGVLAALVVLSPIYTAPINPPWIDHQQNSVLCSTRETHLLLYYTPHCPYSQKVLKYLKKIHKQLPMKNLWDDPQGKEELRAVGGKAQVPCLVINGKAMYESDAIIEWLSQHQNELETISKK